jgi:hypothetical protein
MSLVLLILRLALLRSQCRPAAMLVDGKGTSHEKHNGSKEKQSQYLVHIPVKRLIPSSGLSGATVPSSIF